MDAKRRPRDLGVLTGHTESNALSINNFGYAVANSESSDGSSTAVMWTPDESIVDFK